MNKRLHHCIPQISNLPKKIRKFPYERIIKYFQFFYNSVIFFIGLSLLLAGAIYKPELLTRKDIPNAIFYLLILTIFGIQPLRLLKALIQKFKSFGVIEIEREYSECSGGDKHD